MAWTVLGNVTQEMDPWVIDEVIVSNCTANLVESIVPIDGVVTTSAGNTRVCNLFDARLIIVTPPASRCPVNFSIEAQSATTGALSVRLWGGDLTGMVAKFAFIFKGMKAGGISAM